MPKREDNQLLTAAKRVSQSLSARDAILDARRRLLAETYASYVGATGRESPRGLAKAAKLAGLDKDEAARWLASSQGRAAVLEALRARHGTEGIVTLAWVVQELRDVAVEARGAGEFAPAVSALKLLGLHVGAFQERGGGSGGGGVTVVVQTGISRAPGDPVVVVEGERVP